MQGREAFKNGLRTLLRTHRIESSADVRDVHVSGDLAVAVSRLTVRIIALGTETGMDDVRSGYAFSVFRKRGDAWQLVRDANLLPPPT